jgi:hypothetical protein
MARQGRGIGRPRVEHSPDDDTVVPEEMACCRQILTEHMAQGQAIHALTIRNPF